MVQRTVFISSTVTDLEGERREVRQFLESHPSAVTLRVLQSEASDFPVHSTALVDKSAYEICLDNVAQADAVIQLLKSRYGVADVESDGEMVSITHAEYRAAYRRRIPVFTFVHQDAWAACALHSMGDEQSFIAADQIALCKLIGEIGGSPRKQWLFFFRSFEDIRAALVANFCSFDHSTFVADVTLSG